MVNLYAYPYPTYAPNKIAAGIVAALIGISLIAWFVQSCQARFKPTRISFLLLISHATILIEMIVRASIPVEEQHSKIAFIVTNSLFAMGQRMIIVGNFNFITEVHREKSRYSRYILIIAILGVVSSGILIGPANLYSFNSAETSKSFTFRESAAAILFFVTLFFYPVWFWSKTMQDMNIQGIILMTLSSALCCCIAIFNLVQSTSRYYDEINKNEIWFYVLQIIPIVIAHYTWSVFHPKRSLVPAYPLLVDNRK